MCGNPLICSVLPENVFILLSPASDTKNSGAAGLCEVHSPAVRGRSAGGAEVEEKGADFPIDNAAELCYHAVRLL